MFASAVINVVGGYRKDIDALNRRSSSYDRQNDLAALIMRIIDGCRLCVVDGVQMWFDGHCYVPVGYGEASGTIKCVLMDNGVMPMDLKHVGNIPFLAMAGKVLPNDPALCCFANDVIVDTSSGKVCSPSADLVCTRRFDVAWADDARCDLWHAFLDRVLPDKDVQAVLQEFFGMCFVDRGRISIECLLIMIGTGANGKSVIFDVMKGVLGVENLSFLDPQQLVDPKQVAYVEGKMMNFSPDVKASAAFDSALKSLASSQEVNAWKIYKGSVSLRCPPLVFALNEMPRFLDTTKAFFRRLIIISFGVTIPYKEQDRLLASKIVSREAAGVLQWIFDGARRLVANGGAFTYSKSIEDNLVAVRRKAMESE